MQTLSVEPLTRAAFAPFGEVIEAGAAASVYPINAGSATRFHDVARIDTAMGGGRAVVSLCRAQARALPFAVAMLERHCLGSQAFIPLDSGQRYLVVVADDRTSTPRAFLASHGQGVNYQRGTWHHPLLALDAAGDFLVIDRDGPGENCEEATLSQSWRIEPL
jgi:ureidoglycolate lyase